MFSGKITLFPSLESTVLQLSIDQITTERKEILQVLIDYVQEKKKNDKAVNLNFICTHNSRRSQFSQIWAQTAADYFGVKANCFSGGVEVTSFNDRAVASIKRMGFQVTSKGDGNPIYSLLHSDGITAIVAFSKLYDDPINAAKEFAAVMTCSHADDNCPFIPGTEKRIPVRYEDPKTFDDTSEESAKYDERSLQIATEMFYVFGRV